MRRDPQGERSRDQALRRASERWLALSAEAKRAEVSRSLARIFGSASGDDVERLVAETDAYYHRLLGEA